ncbi:MAG: polysaccharide biosynthesis C-terminal domain-containing protein [Candidatus Omnitrophica bacterium]|nr:polysaccharide biosynthesis C-terminal domain-containing protein [Candidatus Omnitrophota bacterium]
MSTNDIDKLKQTLIFTMKLVFLILIPASLGLIILRVPIIRLLFEHGRFDAESTRRTASVLLFYSLGLFAYGGIHVVVKAYYSLKDTRTPVRIGIIALISNICLNLILMQYLREGGLALATTLSSMLNFALLVFILSKKIGSWGLKEIFILFLKVLLSAGIMAAVAQMLITSLPVLLIIPISIIIFFICCFIFKVEEAGMLLKWVLKKN